MILLAPAGMGPAFVLPAEFSAALDLIRPVLDPGGPPVAVVILVQIEAQGVED